MLYEKGLHIANHVCPVFPSIRKKQETEGKMFTVNIILSIDIYSVINDF